MKKILGLVVLSLAVWNLVGRGSVSTPNPEPASTKGNISGFVKTSAAAAISGATLTAVNSGVTTVATTDSTGSYAFSSIEAGTYTLSASKSGYNSSSESVTVTAGQTASKTFYLTGTNELLGTLEVTVKNSSGEAVSGATVLITNETTSSPSSQTTGTSGVVTFESLTAAKYLIGAFKSSSSGTKEVTVTGGQTTRETVTIRSGSSGGGTFILISPDFANGSTISITYFSSTLGGQDKSIPLSWSGSPEGTKGFALSIIDTATIANNFEHWLVGNIPVSVSSFEAGASPNKMRGATELSNAVGGTAYVPPTVDGEGDHTFVIRVYALNSANINFGTLSVPYYDSFLSKINSSIISVATLEGHHQIYRWNDTIKNICAGCHGTGTKTITDAKNRTIAQFNDMTGTTTDQENKFKNWKDHLEPEN